MEVPVRLGGKARRDAAVMPSRRQVLVNNRSNEVDRRRGRR